MSYIARGCMYCEGICNKECLPKQETLEEAAEKFADDCTLVSDAAAYKGFIAGAKWQQERMYSEEEVLKFLNKREEYMNSEDDILEYKSIDQWFEQFKKK